MNTQHYTGQSQQYTILQSVTNNNYCRSLSDPARAYLCVYGLDHTHYVRERRRLTVPYKPNTYYKGRNGN